MKQLATLSKDKYMIAPEELNDLTHLPRNTVGILAASNESGA
jgi:ubiquinone biosynthesis protein Coq4